MTRILCVLDRGDPNAADELLPLVYDELRRLATARLAAEKPGQTLQATALVHEAYLRLVGDQQFANRGHFFAAAKAMRRVLVDHARRRNREKRGGGRARVELPDVAAPAADPDARLLALDDALARLAAEAPDAARVVELHRFAGLPHEEVAAVLGETVYAVRQKWEYARAWLRDALSDPS